MTPMQQAVTIIHAGSLVCWGFAAGLVLVPLQKGYTLQASISLPGKPTIFSYDTISYSIVVTIAIYGVVVLGVATAILNLTVRASGEWTAYATLVAAFLVYVLIEREYGLIGTPLSFWFVVLPAIVAVAARYFGRSGIKEQ